MRRQEKYFKDLIIPDTWDSVHDFAKWWLFEVRMPHNIPKDSQIFLTDDAVAMCIFKHKNFQIENYILFPGFYIHAHSHPGIDTVQFNIDYHNWGKALYTPSNREHGGSKVDTKGQNMYVFQKWPENVVMTSASVVWKGIVAGPLHKSLIESYYPGVVDKNNYSNFNKNYFK